MFNDSNRKSHPYPYHVLQLKANKKFVLSQPFPSHSSSSIPKCLPHHMIVIENSIRKRTHYCLSTLYLKLVLTARRGENTNVVRPMVSQHDASRGLLPEATAVGEAKIGTWNTGRSKQ